MSHKMQVAPPKVDRVTAPVCGLRLNVSSSDSTLTLPNSSTDTVSLFYRLTLVNIFYDYDYYDR